MSQEIYQQSVQDQKIKLLKKLQKESFKLLRSYERKRAAMEQNTGTLGHFLPGILLTFWGILTVLGAWKNYHRSTVQSSCKYRTTCHPIPSEQALTLGKKMVRAFFLAAPVIGMLGEAITGTHY